MKRERKIEIAFIFQHTRRLPIFIWLVVMLIWFGWENKLKRKCNFRCAAGKKMREEKFLSDSRKKTFFVIMTTVAVFNLMMLNKWWFWLKWIIGNCGNVPFRRTFWIKYRFVLFNSKVWCMNAESVQNWLVFDEFLQLFEVQKFFVAFQSFLLHSKAWTKKGSLTMNWNTLNNSLV